ncbi:hypothetical protein A4X13_0g5620 [Tilletia indica]|uniref:Uncharacterized protein n=1 Tax=Tilletia indica TaxID=43049 RepID=A0A8T8SUJ8_9BASI|nr:hypothetical protein A4X13_0g5620 [Tilletia indica]
MTDAAESGGNGSKKTPGKTPSKARRSSSEPRPSKVLLATPAPPPTTPSANDQKISDTRKAFQRAAEEWSAACIKSGHPPSYAATLEEAVPGSADEILDELSEALIRRLQQLNASEGQPGPGSRVEPSSGDLRTATATSASAAAMAEAAMAAPPAGGMAPPTDPTTSDLEYPGMLCRTALETPNRTYRIALLRAAEKFIDRKWRKKESAAAPDGMEALKAAASGLQAALRSGSKLTPLGWAKVIAIESQAERAAKCGGSEASIDGTECLLCGRLNSHGDIVKMDKWRPCKLPGKKGILYPPCCSTCFPEWKSLQRDVVELNKADRKQEYDTLAAKLTTTPPPATTSELLEWAGLGLLEDREGSVEHGRKLAAMKGQAYADEWLKKADRAATLVMQVALENAGRRSSAAATAPAVATVAAATDAGRSSAAASVNLAVGGGSLATPHTGKRKRTAADEAASANKKARRVEPGATKIAQSTSERQGRTQDNGEDDDEEKEDDDDDDDEEYRPDEE